ncbi:MAG TPA: ECF-type sigma factor [Bryobacteraceae bacterium]|nr:ECF-type sigma factor [Bryobacteraceae bacterium]
MAVSLTPGSQSQEPAEGPELAAVLYRELRRAAAACLRGERPNHTLQPTALVNEAYLRLAAQHQTVWSDRLQFLAAASHLMREILVDYARARNRVKRGGGQTPVRVEDARELAAAPDVNMLELDEALDALDQVDSQQRKIVELRYFGGLSIEETARALGVSPATVKRDWRIARAWLHRELSPHAVREP